MVELAATGIVIVFAIALLPFVVAALFYLILAPFALIAWAADRIGGGK